MDLYRFREGGSPLLISIPHAGTYAPDELSARWTAAARALPDTDWHVDRLYDCPEVLNGLDASLLVATHSRYAIDLNRPPDDQALYPGRDTPGLVPRRTFAGEPLYAPGREPTAAETAARLARYWRPYHDKLASTLEALRARHGFALLWDAHSIRSEVPALFDGRLPDLNLGSGGGASCAPALAARLLAAAREAHAAPDAPAAPSYTAVLDGRFRGGYITRHYGDPARGIHAVQLELAQRRYMDETPANAFRDDLAAQLRPALRRLLTAFAAGPQGARG